MCAAYYDKPLRLSTPPMASTIVGRIPELVEQIILRLPFLVIIRSASRVNRQWKSIVETSTPILLSTFRWSRTGDSLIPATPAKQPPQSYQIFPLLNTIKRDYQFDDPEPSTKLRRHDLFITVNGCGMHRNNLLTVMEKYQCIVPATTELEVQTTEMCGDTRVRRVLRNTEGVNMRQLLEYLDQDTFWYQWETGGSLIRDINDLSKNEMLRLIMLIRVV